MYLSIIMLGRIFLCACVIKMNIIYSFLFLIIENASITYLSKTLHLRPSFAMIKIIDFTDDKCRLFHVSEYELQSYLINPFRISLETNSKKMLMDLPGIEPGTPRCKRGILPLDYRPLKDIYIMSIIIL